MKEQVNTKHHKNYLVRLFMGELSLPVTFWVYGFLIGHVLTRGVLFLIKHNYAMIIKSEHGVMYVELFVMVVFAYNFAIFFAIWRSAGKHNTKLVWSYAARILVVIGLVSYGYLMHQRFISHTDPLKGIQSELALIEPLLPMMINDDLRLDDVRLNGQELIYEYIHLSSQSSEIDSEAFEHMMKSELIKGCDTIEIIRLLKSGYSYKYTYFDADRMLISDVFLALEDCTQ